MLKQRKTYRGEVVRKKTDKTVVVSVTRTVKDETFKKYLRRTTLFMAHDEENASRMGDFVKLIETRPLSARKRWKVLEIVKKGSVERA